jgi:hypothetical protein
MFEEKKTATKESFDHSSTFAERSERNHRLYDTQRIEEESLSSQESEAQEGEADFSDDLSQRLREAQEAASFWKTESEKFGSVTSKKLPP